MFNSKTLFLAGYARLPQGMAAKNIFETLTITVEIDHKYGVIIDTNCTLATNLGKDFIQRIFRGHSLNDGVDELIEKIQNHYKGKAANALIASLKDLDNQFQALKPTNL